MLVHRVDFILLHSVMIWVSSAYEIILQSSWNSWNRSFVKHRNNRGSEGGYDSLCMWCVCHGSLTFIFILTFPVPGVPMFQCRPRGVVINIQRQFLKSKLVEDGASIAYS